MSSRRPILIVDDDADLRVALVDHFNQSGEFTADAAESVAEAEAKLSNAPVYDAMILDIGLPEMCIRDRFASGVAGSVEASRVAVGRQMALTYEVTGTRGALYFTQERLSELQLYQWDGHSRARAGFRTLLIGPEHPDYGWFNQGPGHGLGFNDQKIIECARFMQAIGGGTRPSPDFRDAAHVNLVLDAVLKSAAGGGWVTVPAIGQPGSGT